MKRYLFIFVLPFMFAAASEQCGDSTYKQSGYCPAVLSSPATTNVAETSADVTFSKDRSDGTNYVCVTESATAPATGNLLVLCASGVAATPVVSEDLGTQTVSVADLLGSTAYYAHAVNYSPNGWFSNIVTTAQFTTTTPTVPGQVTGFSLGTPASTSIPASWTAVAGAETYEIYTSGDVLQVDGLTSTSTNITGLTAETPYTFKVRARNSAGAGTFSATDTATTAAAGVATPYYSTDFDTGALVSENGFSWGGTVGDVGVKSTITDSGEAYSGNYALGFVYPATDPWDDSWREIRFKLKSTGTTTLTEVWMEYMFFVPTNFEMRKFACEFGCELGAPDRGSINNYNNKFLYVWAEDENVQDEPEILYEYVRSPAYDEVNDYTYANARLSVCTESGTTACAGDGTFSQPLIQTADIGTWIRIRAHFRVSATDGAAELWADDRLVHSYTGGPIQDYTNNYLRSGYFMGWANTGFDEITKFYIDDLKIYDTDPGW